MHLEKSARLAVVGALLAGCAGPPPPPRPQPARQGPAPGAQTTGQVQAQPQTQAAPLCQKAPHTRQEKSFEEGGVKFPLVCHDKVRLENLCVDVIDIEDLIVAADGCELTIERSQFFYRTNQTNRYGSPHMVVTGGNAKVTLRDVKFNEGLPTILAKGTSNLTIDGGSYPDFQALVSSENATVSVMGASIAGVLAKGSSSVLFGKGSKITVAGSSDSSALRIEDAVVGTDDKAIFEKNYVGAALDVKDRGEVSVVRGDLRSSPEHPVLRARAGKVSVEDSSLTGGVGVLNSGAALTMKNVSVSSVGNGVTIDSGAMPNVLQDIKIRQNPAAKANVITCGIAVNSSQAELRGLDIDLPDASGVCVGKTMGKTLPPAKVSLSSARIKVKANGLVLTDGDFAASNVNVVAGETNAVHVIGSTTKVVLVDSELASPGIAVLLHKSSVELKTTTVKGAKKSGVFTETLR